MVNLSKCKIITIGLVVCLFSVVCAGKAEIVEKSRRQLEFVTSDEPATWGKYVEGMGIIQPTYMASFTVRLDSVRDNISYEPSYKYREKVIRGRVSDRQWQFISQGIKGYLDDFGEKGGLFRTYRVYGVSEQDAYRTAECVINYYDQKAASAMERVTEELETYRRLIPEVENELKVLEPEFEKVCSQYEEIQKVIDLKEEQRLKAKYYENIEDISVEIAGYEARLRTIKIQREKVLKQAAPETMQMLLQMEITEEVELAGAMGREEAFRGSMGRSERKIHKIQKLKSRRNEIRTKLGIMPSEMKKYRGYKKHISLPESLIYLRDRVELLEKQLVEPPASWLPVTVHENKVTVHPVDLEKSAEEYRKRPRRGPRR
ncbi:MAG: hypothetical protein KAT56_11830 [Sedimentisphaerales bacterium]|nr:hypothetical protein [Sedimentisphaerales bacterium]